MKFKENLKQLFVEPLKTAFLQSHLKKVWALVCFDSVILLFMEVIPISWISTIHM